MLYQRSTLWGPVTKQFLTICSYHITYAFQSESTLYDYLNVKELLARNRRDIWNLSEYNETRTHNHLVRKQTLNHLAKLVELSGCRFESRCSTVFINKKTMVSIFQLQSFLHCRFIFHIISLMKKQISNFNIDSNSDYDAGISK